MDRNVLPKYNQHVCNIADCDNPVYKSGMCKEHYQFNMSSPETVRVINEMDKLKSGTATWGAEIKKSVSLDMSSNYGCTDDVI